MPALEEGRKRGFWGSPFHCIQLGNSECAYLAPLYRTWRLNSTRFCPWKQPICLEEKVPAAHRAAQGRLQKASGGTTVGRDSDDSAPPSTLLGRQPGLCSFLLRKGSSAWLGRWRLSPSSSGLGPGRAQEGKMVEQKDSRVLGTGLEPLTLDKLP